MKTEFETATTDLARRVPPHSAEAERAVLAGLILRPSAMGQIAPMLHPEDFYLPAHQTLYAAALGLHTDNRPVDLVTLAEHLRDQGSLEQAGGAAISRSWRSRMSARQTPSITPSSCGTNPSSAGSSRRGQDRFHGLRHVKGSGRAHRRGPSSPSWPVSSRTSSGGFRPVQALVGDVVDAVLKPPRAGSPGSLPAIPNSMPSRGGSSLRI